MEIIFGFIVMLVLIAISLIPNILVLIFKKSYGKPMAFCLFLVSFFIYIVLKVRCIENGILQDSNNIPIIAMFAFYLVASWGVVLNNLDKEEKNKQGVIE